VSSDQTIARAPTTRPIAGPIAYPDVDGARYVVPVRLADGTWILVATEHGEVPYKTEEQCYTTVHVIEQWRRNGFSSYDKRQPAPCRTVTYTRTATYLSGLEPSTSRKLWGPLEDAGGSIVALTDGTFLSAGFSRGLASVRYDARSGRRLGGVQATPPAPYFCVSPQSPRLWTADPLSPRLNSEIDAVTGVVAPSEGPRERCQWYGAPSCPRSATAECVAGRDDLPACPAGACVSGAPFELPDFAFVYALREGATTVAFGARQSADETPGQTFWFGGPPPPRRVYPRHLPTVIGIDESGVARWRRELPAPGDRVAREGWPSVAEVGGGRAYVVYDAWERSYRWTALDARTGATIWDRPFTVRGGMTYAEGRLYARDDSGLHVFDSATGEELTSARK
jgi:hypothetical protein